MLKYYSLYAVFFVITVASLLGSNFKARENFLITQYTFKAASPYYNIIVREANNNGLDPELVAAIIIKESCTKYYVSGYHLEWDQKLNKQKQVADYECSYVDPFILGGVGEVGLMQIHPDHNPKNPAIFFNPQTNISFGSAYLRKMINMKGSLQWGISAYNTGPGNRFFSAKYVNHVINNYNDMKSKRKFVLFREHN